jgi:uncharacterized protein YggE
MSLVPSLSATRNTLATLLLTALGSIAIAAEAERGITVSGQAVIEAMPDVVELVGSISGTAELAGDAAEKYRGSKRLATEAFGKLNIEGLKVEGAGMGVNAGTPANVVAMMQGQEEDAGAVPKVSVEESITVRIAGIDTMPAEKVVATLTQIVDAAKDAGVVLGPGPLSMMQVQFTGGRPSSLATFRLSKGDELRAKAYDAALKQARAKAEGLAKLSGVKLGEIVAIREMPATPDADDGQSGMAAYLAIFGAQVTKAAVDSSTQFKPIPVSVRLNVQFAIAK